MPDVRPYGYVIPCSYVGYYNGKKQEYPTEREYLEMLDEDEPDTFEDLLNDEMTKLKGKGKGKGNDT